jgi:uncharacterized protein (TIGR02246 family)
MRTSTATALTLAIALLVPAAGARADAAADGIEEAKAGIAKSNAKLEAAVKAGDAAAIGALYTSDALVLAPDQEIATGRAGAEKVFGGMLKAGAKNVSLHTETVERAGDYAIETGTVTVAMQPEGKPAQTSSGKYVVVWKRQSDGTWQLHRDIWNDNPPAKN